MLGGAYSKAEMKKMQVYEWHKHFVMGMKQLFFFFSYITMHLHIDHWWSNNILPRTM
jgi:hypothetical protein